MKICKNCGSQNRNGEAAFCENCGAAFPVENLESKDVLSENFGTAFPVENPGQKNGLCENCGTPLTDGGSFCPECGFQNRTARIESGIQGGGQYTQNQAQQQYTQYQNQAQPQYTQYQTQPQYTQYQNQTQNTYQTEYQSQSPAKEITGKIKNGAKKFKEKIVKFYKEKKKTAIAIIAAAALLTVVLPAAAHFIGVGTGTKMASKKAWDNAIENTLGEFEKTSDANFSVVVKSEGTETASETTLHVDGKSVILITADGELRCYVREKSYGNDYFLYYEIYSENGVYKKTPYGNPYAGDESHALHITALQISTFKGAKNFFSYGFGKYSLKKSKTVDFLFQTNYGSINSLSPAEIKKAREEIRRMLIDMDVKINLKFKNGKVAELVFDAKKGVEKETLIIKCEFGNTSITLPSV